MAKGAVNMSDTENIIELSNIEIYEYCTLNIKTGEKEYYKTKKKTDKMGENLCQIFIQQKINLQDI